MEIIKKTLEFLHPLAIKEDYVTALNDEMRRAKSAIDIKLDLNEGNAFRRIIDYSITEVEFEKIYPNAYKYINLLAEGNEFSVTGNWIKTPNKQKLSKFISKPISEEKYMTCTLRNALYTEVRNGDLSTVFDIVKPKKIIISTNMYDFFTSSSNAAFRSCYTLDGCHFNGNIAYMRDTFTFMIFTYSKDIYRKIGRTWGYLLDSEQSMFLTSKIYGSMYSSEIGTAIQTIQHAINPKRKWKSHGMKYKNYSHAKPHSDDTRPVYFDYTGIILHYIKRRPKLDDLPHLKFKDITCLICGEHTYNGNFGMCYNCSANMGYCDYCNGAFHTDMLVDGRNICRECCDKHYTPCTNCGNFHLNDHLNDVDTGKICIDCLRSTHRKCIVCATFHLTDGMREYNGVYVCSRCKDKIYTCSRCEALVIISDNLDEFTHEGNRVCVECHEGAVNTKRSWEYNYRWYIGKITIDILNNDEVVDVVFSEILYGQPRVLIHKRITFHEIDRRYYDGMTDLNGNIKTIAEDLIGNALAKKILEGERPEVEPIRHDEVPNTGHLYEFTPDGSGTILTNRIQPLLGWLNV